VWMTEPTAAHYRLSSTLSLSMEALKELLSSTAKNGMKSLDQIVLIP